MNKFLSFLLIASIFNFGSYGYNGSTKSVVALVGGVIKGQNIEVSKKYKRKDCPVCKGKGYYISGDGIAKVECGYCEVEKTQISQKVVVHPPTTLKSNCPDGSCNHSKIK